MQSVDHSTLAIVAGIVSGLLFIPCGHFGYRLFWPNDSWRPRIFIQICAFLASIVMLAFAAVLPAWILGVFPLKSEWNKFGCAFLIAGLVVRLIVEYRRRHGARDY